MEFSHVSVLPDECMEGLNIKPDGIYADGTTGGGGHSYLIASRLSDKGRLICIDRDDDALEAAGKRLAPLGKNITFVKNNFSRIKEVLEDLGIEKIDGILFDLGVSSYQLDNGERGFSYMTDAPLDMRMDRQQQFSAYNVVNEYSRDDLKRIIKDYGEERYAGPIAAAICRRREEKPIETTLELTEIIKSAMPAAAKREKQHPAKRTFQALRIEVNSELSSVEEALGDSIDALAPGGRIAVISFHSLEDRIVKRKFAAMAQGCTCPKSFPVCVCGNKPKIKLVSRGVIIASDEELENNPRSRSAKLRVAEKL
ncbi:MAG: 16S rRNA (cytosine(1402)-N(4))-methyltransferase RsmH [Clostridia bacterium]|nr:16S rRNA (cytosine(1402)-N(4))-methyltransferase RsmH [Clostridia bacterium]MBQ5813939.1 16S rRNA (cytosine(1402)-N(4))-methyltransferase RsmH [Clostridia bacterium]